MKRPEIENTEAAIRHYYGTGYIGNKEILEIFGNRGAATVAKLKKAVRAEEIERKIPEVVPNKINVNVAYEVWNIDVDMLVKNRKRLQALGL